MGGVSIRPNEAPAKGKGLGAGAVQIALEAILTRGIVEGPKIESMLHALTLTFPGYSVRYSDATRTLSALSGKTTRTWSVPVEPDEQAHVFANIVDTLAGASSAQARMRFLRAFGASFDPFARVFLEPLSLVGGPIRYELQLRQAEDGWRLLASDETAGFHIPQGARAITINGVPISGLTYGQIKAIGEPHTVVYEAAGRRTEVSIPVTISQPDSVTLVRFQGGVATVSVTRFDRGTTRELYRTLKSLNGLDAVVLDLRGNYGGTRQEALGVVGLFLDEKRTIMRTWYGGSKCLRGQGSSAGSVTSPFCDVRLVLMVDAHTASSSEIVVGGLQGRAVSVGLPTLGKGLGQAVVPLVPALGEHGPTFLFTSMELRVLADPSAGNKEFKGFYRRGFAPTVPSARVRSTRSDDILQAARGPRPTTRTETSRLDNEEDMELARVIATDATLYQQLLEIPQQLGPINPKLPNIAVCTRAAR